MACALSCYIYVCMFDLECLELFRSTNFGFKAPKYFSSNLNLPKYLTNFYDNFPVCIKCPNMNLF